MKNIESQKASFKATLNRRDFIKTGGAVGAGLVFAPLIMTKARANDSNDLNIALLGAGAQGQVLMNAMLKIPNIRFKAVCDIWPYRLEHIYKQLKLAYKFDVNAYDNYEQMLEKEKSLDAAIIATPDWLHAPMSIACLKHRFEIPGKSIDGTVYL